MDTRKPIINFVLDFDDTVCCGNCQDPVFNYNLQRLNAKYEPLGFPIRCADDYWKTLPAGDREITYLQAFMADIHDGTLLNELNEPIRSDDLTFFGRDIQLIDRIGAFIIETKRQWEGVADIRFHIVSVGIRELISGCKIASLFDSIHANAFDENITRIQKFLNGFSKIAAVIEIIKGSDFNCKMRHESYDGDYKNTICVGDSSGDIPMMCYLRKKGATTIGLYANNSEESYSEAMKLLGDRVENILPRRYDADAPIRVIVNKAISKMLNPARCSFPSELQHMVKKRKTGDASAILLVSKHIALCDQCMPGFSTTFIEP